MAVEHHRASDTPVLYNNGLVPTCLVELYMVGMASPIFSNPSCTPVNPGDIATITLGLINPLPKTTFIGRTINNTITTFTA